MAYGWRVLGLVAWVCGVLGCGQGAGPDPFEVAGAEAPLISRTDDRNPPGAIGDAAFAAQACGHVAALVDDARVQQDLMGVPYLSASPLHDRHEGSYGVELCRDERFALEPTAAFCSGTLIAPDLVLTAGHCISAADCGITSIVFGYEASAEGVVQPLDAANIYACQSVLVRSDRTGGTPDYAVVRLDRPVVGRTPAPVLRDPRSLPLGLPISAAGHPLGLPLKITEGGVTKPVPAGYLTQEPQYFAADIDAFPASSGSGAFLTELGGSHALTGVLSAVLDQTEYRYDAERDCDRYERLAFTSVWISYAHYAVSALCAAVPAGTYPELCSCGNGTCDAAAGEDGTVCATDCDDACGDGECLGAETPLSCAADCGTCGDGLCGGAEACCEDCGCAAGLSCEQSLCVPDLEVAGATCQSPIELIPGTTHTLHTPSGSAACYRFTLTEPRRVRWQGNASTNAPICTEAECSSDRRYGPYATLAAGTYWMPLPGDNTLPRTYRVLFDAPSNDDGLTCDAAIPIVPQLGVASVSGTTAHSFKSFACADGTSYSCYGPDQHYTFTITQPTSLRALASGFPHITLVLRSGECTGGPTFELAIDRAGTGSARFQRTLPPGVYELAVDGERSFDEGAFELDLRFDTPPVPDGDDCHDPITIAPQGAYSLSGDTSLAANDFFYGHRDCLAEPYGSDHFYSFTLTEKTRIEASVASSYRASLFLTEGACEGTLRCERGTQGISRVLDPGTYTLVVDGQEAFDAGEYLLSVEFIASPAREGESCEDAVVLVPTGQQRLTGDLTTASDDAHPRCASATYGDRLYTFTLPEPRTVRVDATGASGTYVDIGTSCPSSAGRVCLGLSATSRTSNQTLEAGTHFLVVDTRSRATGPYDIVIDFESEATGASCLDPLPLPIAPAAVTVSAAGHVSGASKRLYYGFTLGQTSRIELSGAAPALLTLIGPGASTYPARSEIVANVPAGRYCTELAAAAATPSLALTASATAVQTLEGHTCSEAIPLTVPGTQQRTGYASFGNYPNTCGSGPAQMYSFELTEPTQARFVATNGFTLSIYRDAACSQLAYCSSGFGSVLDDLLAPGSYKLSIAGPSLVPYELTATFDCDPDDDGVCSASDVCPYNPTKTTSIGQCGCSYTTELDFDDDGVADCVDACPTVAGTVAGCPDVDPPDAAVPDATVPDATVPDATVPDATVGGDGDGDGDGDEDAGSDEDAGVDPQPPTARDAGLDASVMIGDASVDGSVVNPPADSGVTQPADRDASPEDSAPGPRGSRSGCSCSAVALQPVPPSVLLGTGVLALVLTLRVKRRKR